MQQDLGSYESDLTLEKIEEMILATKHDEKKDFDNDTNLLLNYVIYTVGFQGEYKNMSAVKFH